MAAPAGFAALLRSFRDRAGLAQEELAYRAGLSVRAIRDLESGRATQPRERTVELLAEALTLDATDADRLAAAARGGGGPAGLAPDPDCFTGRVAELATLDRFLDREGPVLAVIEGGAGIGKTALALHWAHRLRERYPDGQLYLDLRAYHADAPPLPVTAALAQLLAALGVASAEVPLEPEDAAGLYRSLLADRRVLVVLDNAGRPDQVRPLLPGSASCLTVVTSRDRLTGLVARDGAARLALGALPAAEAATLVTALTGRVGEPVAELVRACGQVPLALRIASADLGRAAIEPYVRELARGGPLTDAVRAAFDLSYARLAGPDRRLFRLLGLMPGSSVSVPAASALAGGDASAGLDRLAGAHLVEENAADRYALHDLMRAYARELAVQEGGEPAAVARLDAWYLYQVDAAARLAYPQILRLPLPERPADLAVEPFAGAQDAAAWLVVEQPNLVAAVLAAAARGRHEAAYLLGDALRGHLWMRGAATTWERVSQAQLAAAEAAADDRAIAAALLSRAMACLRRGDFRAGARANRRALTHARAAGWGAGEAGAVGNLGRTYEHLGRRDKSVAYYRKAIVLAEAAGDEPRVATNLGNLAVQQFFLGRLREAAAGYAAGIAANERLGIPMGVGLNWMNLGAVRSELGDYPGAAAALDRALAVFRQLGVQSYECHALLSVVLLHRNAGRPEQAREVAAAAQQLAGEVGDGLMSARVRYVLGELERSAGRAEQALAHLEVAMAAYGELSGPQEEALALLSIAWTYTLLGRYDDVERAAARVLEVARAARYRLLEAAVDIVRAHWHLVAGDWAAAEEPARKATARWSRAGAVLTAAGTRVFLATALHRLGRGDEAAPLVRGARRVFAEHGVVWHDLDPALLAELTAVYGR
jgi:tetratricopeptide (TPR) repeat protein/transcriptional regulator with XRE-family HTH domain